MQPRQLLILLLIPLACACNRSDRHKLPTSPRNALFLSTTTSPPNSTHDSPDSLPQHTHSCFLTLQEHQHQSFQLRPGQHLDLLAILPHGLPTQKDPQSNESRLPHDPNGPNPPSNVNGPPRDPTPEREPIPTSTKGSSALTPDQDTPGQNTQPTQDDSPEISPKTTPQPTALLLAQDIPLLAIDPDPQSHDATLSLALEPKPCAALTLTQSQAQLFALPRAEDDRRQLQLSPMTLHQALQAQTPSSQNNPTRRLALQPDLPAATLRRLRPEDRLDLFAQPNADALPPSQPATPLHLAPAPSLIPLLHDVRLIERIEPQTRTPAPKPKPSANPFTTKDKTPTANTADKQAADDDQAQPSSPLPPPSKTTLLLELTTQQAMRLLLLQDHATLHLLRHNPKHDADPLRKPLDLHSALQLLGATKHLDTTAEDDLPPLFGPQPPASLAPSPNPGATANRDASRPLTTPAYLQGDQVTLSLQHNADSFALAREDLYQGRPPRPESLTLQSWLNAFRYLYPTPQLRRPLQPFLTLAPNPMRDDPGAYLLHVGIQVEPQRHADRPPTRLIFLLHDTDAESGAVDLDLAKHALIYMTKQLKPDDQIALLSSHKPSPALLALTPGEQLATIQRAILSLSSTRPGDLEQALQQAARLARSKPAMPTRIILLNRAPLDPKTLPALLTSTETLHASRLHLSTVCTDPQRPDLPSMRKLAQAGGGRSFSLHAKPQAQRIISQLLLASNTPTLSQAELHIEFHDSLISSWTLLGYPNHADSPQALPLQQPLLPGQQFTALFELQLDLEAKRYLLATLRLRYTLQGENKPREHREILNLDDHLLENPLENPDFTLASSLAAIALHLRDQHRGQPSRIDLDKIRALAQKHLKRHPEQQPLLQLLDQLIKTTP